MQWDSKDELYKKQAIWLICDTKQSYKMSEGCGWEDRLDCVPKNHEIWKEIWNYSIRQQDHQRK